MSNENINSFKSKSPIKNYKKTFKNLNKKKLALNLDSIVKPDYTMKVPNVKRLDAGDSVI